MALIYALCIYCINILQCVSLGVSTDVFGAAWSAEILILPLIFLVKSRPLIDDRMHRDL